ncbi:MAG TPA: transglutaminase-like domain-containing protein [Elusimicrobiota bacterium]|nr:transglutaminase-like domain-containing protein [Elusimicrobiota bacterium]
MPYNISGLQPGDNGITETVNAMVTAVKWSLQHYDLRARAELLIASCQERDELCEVRSIFKWVLAHFRYVRDPRFLEMFKSPEIVDQEISARGQFQGDCDDVSGYLAALLLSIGYPVKFVVINVVGQGDDFRHIYMKVYLPRSKGWMALEATARLQPAGWEAPNGGRVREYPVL